MRRPLFNIILLTIIGVVAIWLGDRPGDLVLRWPGYELRTSVATGIGVTLFTLFIFLVMWRGYAWLINWPERFKDMRRKQKKARGESAMAGSLMSLAEGNVAEASKAALEAQNNLSDHALPLLLAAQAARMDGNHSLAEKKYKALIGFPAPTNKQNNPKELGYRGLFSMALAEGKQDEAREHLQHTLAASAVKSKPVWALQGLFQIEAGDGNWQEALKLVDQLAARGGLEKSDAKRLRAVLLVAEGQALALQLAENENAEIRAQGLKLVQRAIILVPDFIPALVLASQLASTNNGGNSAHKIVKRIEQLWKKTPHPDLVSAYLALQPGKSALQNLKLVQKLTAKNRTHSESRIALASAAIKARRWSMARVALRDEAETPTRRVCRLMADLEIGENEDAGLAREWMDRALTAAPDACWVGPTGEAASWQAVCPVTGQIDAFKWGHPVQVMSSASSGTALIG